MCGIAGMLNFDSNRKADPRLLQRMCDAIAHRGPDDEGLHVDGPVGMGMRRLSIIDVGGGHQPIFNEDRSLCIVFNGEIYNHQDIRREMLAKGHTYATQTDTESILHLYEEIGEHCVEKLRGMFAFAIWDSRRRRLFLARDRVGIKPLFYRAEGERLLFASEIKAILQDPTIPRDIDWQALDAYFALSYIVAPRTIFRGVSHLLPGHYLVWEDGKLRTEKYWDLVYRPNHKARLDDLCAEFLHVLREAVGLHLISDVPLGAFLSGGIDSTTVVALMSEHMREPVKTFTIGFGGTVGGFEDERPFARLAADRYGTDHHELEVRPNLEGVIEKIVTGFDEPFADDSSIPTYYVSEMTRKHVKVALSGLGGDELLGGYERYLGFSWSESYARIPRWMRRTLFARAVGGLPESKRGGEAINRIKRFIQSADLPPAERYFAYRALLSGARRAGLFAEDVRSAIDFSRVEADCARYYHAPNDADPLDRAMYQDVKVYLPDDILANTDRMSMAHSLEVRVPFLDHKVMEFCATIPHACKVRGFQKKYLFRKAVAHLLPEQILRKKKQGFVGPMASWLRHDLKEYVRDTLSEGALKAHGLFTPRAVTDILDEHFTGRRRHDTLIWALVIFQVWHKLYLRRGIGAAR
nr:asparagine synthase (glutamine-hydrolyzing) [Nitrospirota bacterium]